MKFYLTFLLSDPRKRVLLSTYWQKCAETFFALNGLDYLSKKKESDRAHGLLFFIPIKPIRAFLSLALTAIVSMTVIPLITLYKHQHIRHAYRKQKPEQKHFLSASDYQKMYHIQHTEQIQAGYKHSGYDEEHPNFFNTCNAWARTKINSEKESDALQNENRELQQHDFFQSLPDADTKTTLLKKYVL